MKTPFLTCLLFTILALAGHTASACFAHRPPSDSIIIKSMAGEGKSKIRLLSNYSNTGSFQVSTEASGELHLYVFDVEGTLICSLNLQEKSRKIMPPLKKGMYTYDVFKNEISIEQGEIIAR